MTKREVDLSHEGFTLLELIVVIAGLGILSSLAIPNFVKYLQFAQIDEAKSLLNAAASECLQELRRTTDESWKNFEPEALKARKSSTEGGLPVLPGNYQYQDGNNTCEEVQIYDPAGGDTIFPMLRFRIDASGRVFKDSQYFNDESKRDCETWGNCGGSESADYLIQCKAEKSVCETNYTQFVSTQRDGGPWPVNKWSGSCSWPKDQSAGCKSTAIYTFENRVVSGNSLQEMAAQYEELKKKRFTGICNGKIADATAALGNPKNGVIDIPDCGVYERYFKGNQLDCADSDSCEIAYLAASEKEREMICTAALGQWKERGADGKFSEPGCEVKWQCNKEILATANDYEKSSCGKPPTPICVPSNPADFHRVCPSNPNHRFCTGFIKC